jgi:hypothetical protein
MARTKQTPKRPRRPQRPEFQIEAPPPLALPKKRARKNNKDDASRKHARKVVVIIDSEGDEPTRPPKKRKTGSSIKQPIVVADDSGIEVTEPEEDKDVKMEDAPAHAFNDPHALGLFFTETASKQRYAKRILCIRSTIEPNNTVIFEDSESRNPSNF